MFKGSEKKSVPVTLKEILQVTNIRNSKKRNAALWLYITALYEIWCWYTQARWKEVTIPQKAIANIVTIRLKYEFNLLY
ncbi:4685_t:CDS:1, partial [Ambispora leptoticha]